jgi:hypothetical protein
MIDPQKFGQYMERLDNVCAALERNTVVQEATIQANNQRHDENEKRISILEKNDAKVKTFLEGGYFSLKTIVGIMFVILCFALNGALDGLKHLMEWFRG